jgi:hypothetical protein
MRRSFALLILSASLCLTARPAWTDSSSGFSFHIQQPKMTPTAEKALDALGKMFDARDGLSAFNAEYRSVTYEMDGLRHFSPYTVTVTGEMQKPNKMNLKLAHGTEPIGSVVSDGITVTYYNAKTNTYARFPAPASYDVTASLSGAPGDGGGGKADDAGDDPLGRTPREVAEGVFGNEAQQEPALAAIAGAEFLLRKTTTGEAQNVLMCLGDVKQTETGPVEIIDLSRKTTTSNTIDGQKVSSSSIARMHFAFDEASGIPRESSSSTTMNFDGYTNLIHGYDFRFTSIAPSQASFLAADFAWSAPAGAKPYREPKEADPFAAAPK